MRFALAANRQIGVHVLKALMENGHQPLALIVSQRKEDVHAEELIALADLPDSHVLNHKNFKTDASVALLQSLDLDYIFGIHFPHIIPKQLLDIPKIGFLNLHPSYLPYNKGWHTPSWAILENTPVGATLHYMSEALDEGDIIAQQRVAILPEDSANTLYARILDTELELFLATIPELASLNPPRYEQQGSGSSHNKKDLLNMQHISLEEEGSYKELLDRLRALTTNRVDEAAYFEKDGKRYAVQVQITEIPN